MKEIYDELWIQICELIALKQIIVDEGCALMTSDACYKAGAQ
jgi:hypothetical protein